MDSQTYEAAASQSVPFNHLLEELIAELEP
jgi:hypothetical protein